MAYITCPNCRTVLFEFKGGYCSHCGTFLSKPPKPIEELPHIVDAVIGMTALAAVKAFGWAWGILAGAALFLVVYGSVFLFNWLHGVAPAMSDKVTSATTKLADEGLVGVAQAVTDSTRSMTQKVFNPILYGRKGKPKQLQNDYKSTKDSQK